MQIAFILDPIVTLQPHHDTSLALMSALDQRHHDIYSLELRDMYFKNGEVWGNLRHLQLTLQAPDWYQDLGQHSQPLSQCHAIWMRKDPPVDAAYIYATQLLDLIPPPTLVLNHPASLRSANEKLYALQFHEWIPKTIVSSAKVVIREFIEQEGQVVLKPLDGKGGERILIARHGDPTLNSLIELVTNRGQVPIMAQEYLPAAQQGDKRILLLEGEPIGAVNRLPGQGDFRGNIAAGGRVEKTVISGREQALCQALASTLRQEKLYFVGIDVIGEHLTEVNVTSPTMLQEISALNQVDLAGQVAMWLEQKVKSLT